MGISYGSITVTDITDITDVYLQYGLALAGANVTNAYPFNGTGEVSWSTTYPTWVSGYQVWIREVTIKEGIALPDYGTPYLDIAVNQINTNLINLQTKVKKIWSDNTGTHMASGIGNNDVTENDTSTYGFNSWINTSSLNFKYNNISLMEMGLLANNFNGIKLYSPITTNGVISGNRLDATLDADGLTLLKGGIVAGNYTAGQNGYIYLSTENGPRISINGFTPGTGQNDPQWRAIIGTKFGVLSDGSLYARNGKFNGRIEATEGYFNSSVTIGNGGTALSTIEANAKQSQVYQIGGNGTAGYHFLGTLKLNSQTDEADIEIHTGDGQNNGAYQNLTIRVNIKRGWQGEGSGVTNATAAGITVRYEDDPTIVTSQSDFQIKVTCTNGYAQGLFNVYLYSTKSYADGWYQVKGRGYTWTHSGAYGNDATPTGVEQTNIRTMNSYTTATNYFTDISGGGVYVHSSDTPSSSSAENAKGVKITDQIDIIRNGESVAEFGALARIGKENESSIKCLPNGIIGIGNGASEYFNFSDSGSSVTTSRRYMLGRTTTDNMHRFPILADGPLSFNLTYHNITNSFTILITILIPYSDSLYDNLRVEFDYTFTYGTGTTSTLNKTVSYEYNGSTESRTIYITYDGSVTLSNIYIDSPINSLYPDSEQYYVELLYAETAMSPSFSIGGNNAANGAYSCAIGCDNTIGNLTSLLSGDYSVAEGQNNKVNAKWSHAEGYNNKIVPSSDGTPILGAHAEGRGNEVKYSYGHAEGYNTESNGNSAHSEGNGTYAYGNAAHAEGYQTKAQANSAHAEGFYTQATAGYAHAEGYYSIASGQCSHAEGYQTKARGFRSHASGLGTEANLDDQTVIGRYNELDPGDGMYPLGSKYAFIVGNGVDDGDDITRSNALTVDWDGNITINGHSSPIGTTASHIPDAISCDSGKYYQVAYLTLDPGTWIISGSARFQQSNTTGIRRVLFTNDTSNYNNVTTQPGSLGNIWYQTFNGSAFPASGAADVKTTSAPVNVTTTNPTIRLIAYQSSGSAMNVIGRFYAIRIK